MLAVKIKIYWPCIISRQFIIALGTGWNLKLKKMMNWFVACMHIDNMCSHAVVAMEIARMAEAGSDGRWVASNSSVQNDIVMR